MSEYYLYICVGLLIGTIYMVPVYLRLRDMGMEEILRVIRANFDYLRSIIVGILRVIRASLDYLKSYFMSSPYEGDSIFNKILNLFWNISRMLLLSMYIVLLNYMFGLNECMYRQYAMQTCFNLFIVLISFYLVLTMAQNYFTLNWDFLRSWPTSHKAVLFWCTSIIIIFFSCLLHSPLFFDLITIEGDCAPLAEGVMEGGCSEYCTVGPGCVECFYTFDFSYCWDFGFELQRQISINFSPTVIIYANIDHLIGLGVTICPISLYWLTRKSK